MAAPSSDFETADYAPLRACSLAARGLWTDMRYLMRQSRRFGYLYQEGKPMSLRQLALTTGCTTDEARSLAQELIDAGLLEHREHEGYFAPRMVAYESYRVRCTEGGKKGGNPKLLKGSNRRVNRTSNPSPNPTANPSVPDPAPAPLPPVSLPYNPSLPTPLTPPPPLPIPSESAGALADAGTVVGAGEGEDGTPPQPTPRKGKPAKFPPGVWTAATAGWENAYRFVHGRSFLWDSRQAAGLRNVLVALKSDLAAFESVAKAWLREPEMGLAKGHPLWQLATDLNHIENKIAKGTVGQNGHASPRKSNPFIGTGRALPDVPEADRVA